MKRASTRIINAATLFRRMKIMWSLSLRAGWLPISRESDKLATKYAVE